MKNRTTMISIALIALIGIASAAVFVGTNPTADVVFGKPLVEGPAADPITALVSSGGPWSTQVDIAEMDADAAFEMQLRVGNTAAVNKTGIMTFTLGCDEGLSYVGEGMNTTIADIDSMIYTNFTGVGVPCNVIGSVIQLNSTHAKIIPEQDPFTFAAETPYYGSFSLDLVPLAYGNYTLSVGCELT